MLKDAVMILAILYFSFGLFMLMYDWLDRRTRRKKLLDSLNDLKKLAEDISEDDEEP